MENNRNVWDNLSMREKATMIGVAVRNGIVDLQEIRQRYNEFAMGGDTEEELKPASVSEARRMGALVGVAPFTRSKSYIGGDRKQTWDKYWQTDNEMYTLTDSVAREYGINPDLLRYRLNNEGYTDARVKEINKDYADKTNKAVLGEALFKSDAMPYVAGDEFGLDDTATYINEGKVNLINENWGDGQFLNEKGGWTNMAMGHKYSDNLGIMAATLKYFRDLAKKDFPNASNADLDRYAAAYYNRGPKGGREWVKRGAKGYKLKEFGGPLVDAAMENIYGLGDWLRKGWNFIKNSAQVASVAENPAVMTAAGHRVTRNGKVAQDRQKDSNVENLRDNLFTLGEWSAVAPTLVGDVEAAYQVARHPIQTAKAIKEGAKEVARRAAEGLEQFAIKLGRDPDKASTLSNDAVNTALQTARDYKNSEGYKQLVRRSIEESKAIGTGDFPEETFFTGIHEQTPQVIMETRPKGRVASYNKTKNTINIDPEQVLEGEEVPFHEGLHWQRVGHPSLNIGPKYERWSSSVINNAPESESILAFHDFYTSPEYAKYQQLENAEQFLEKKVAKVLYDDVAKDSEMKKAHELIAHSMEAGKAQGIEPFTSYPGFQNAIEAIDKARKYDSFLYDIKAGSEEEVSNFWKLLTGNYIPSVVLGGVTAKTLKD